MCIARFSMCVCVVRCCIRMCLIVEAVRRVVKSERDVWLFDALCLMSV